MGARIKIFVIDIDGTFTDGSIYYDETGNEIKKFSVKDGVGLVIARACGIRIMVLTGRACGATERRMRELGVDYLFQEIKDKRSFLSRFMAEHDIKEEELGYIGDDLNDLAAMGLAGFVGCPADACREVRELAKYISPLRGGCGAVRDVIEYFLTEAGQWDAAVDRVYGDVDRRG